MTPKLTVLRLWIATFGLLLFSTVSFSQQKTINGKITDANNQPVNGATVLVKGTANGVTTNESGNFTITVPNTQSTLVVSYVGFENIEIPANKSDFNITFTDRTSALNEVIVTGYSSQAKKSITGSVSVVNTKELIANPGSNVESLLQGRAAGLTVGTSGVPGAGSNVRIHGYSTFGNNEPLYVVDGTRVTSISDLNPGDIESMQVLKDASAASIYGSAAAGGVIIITTKRGKSGAPKVTYEAYYGRQTFNKRLDLMNTKEYGDYLFLLQKNAGQLDAQGQFKHGQYAGPTGVSTENLSSLNIFMPVAASQVEKRAEYLLEIV
ncbi:MAG: TonB-dependent receptor plug domain-containing protein, partial [Chitinophagaceae bacterium]|nr:TonB-dependent receptor plug domain-containing protein [Chitinophagaceae bacterium]